MTVLSIETATSLCGASVIREGVVLGVDTVDMPQVHSEKIITVIDTSLANAAVALRDIDGVAVSIGPGSFTGLRIGLSTAKGLCFALGKPLVAVPTLEAIAMRALLEGGITGGETVVALLRARRDEAFVAAYRSKGGLTEVCFEARILSYGELLKEILHLVPVVLCGNAAAEAVNAHAPLQRDGIRTVPAAIEGCHPVPVGILGEDMLRRGNVADTATIEPMYVREAYVLPPTSTAHVR